MGEVGIGVGKLGKGTKVLSEDSSAQKDWMQLLIL